MSRSRKRTDARLSCDVIQCRTLLETAAWTWHSGCFFASFSSRGHSNIASPLLHDERPEIRISSIAEEPRVYSRGRAHASPRDRGKHGGLQPRQYGDSPTAAVSQF